jgi:hypothetical protein
MRHRQTRLVLLYYDYIGYDYSTLAEVLTEKSAHFSYSISKTLPTPAACIDWRLAWHSALLRTHPEIEEIPRPSCGSPINRTRVVVVHIGSTVVPQDPAVLCSTGVCSNAVCITAHFLGEPVAPGRL